MMDQAQIYRRQTTKMPRCLQVEFKERKDSCPVPKLHLMLDPRRPQQIWPLGAFGGFFWGRRAVHVIASTVVLRAVSTVLDVSLTGMHNESGRSMLRTHHCGKLSSHRICLLLQVLQPFRDFVWLLRGGPPPGPAISLRRVPDAIQKLWLCWI